MMKIRTLIAFVFVFIFATGVHANSPDDQSGADLWRNIWSSPTIDLAETGREHVKNAGDLGKDLEGKEWETLSTKYHRIYYQPSIDKDKLKQVAGRLDN